MLSLFRPLPPSWGSNTSAEKCALRRLRNRRNREYLESPLCPPDHERGPSIDTPLVQPASGTFYASYHVQNIKPYQNINESLHTGCMVCGKSRDQIKEETINWYMERSTPRSEPAYITALRREAYSNGLNAGSFLFLTPAVSQAASCDSTKITTTAEGQEIATGTVPTY